MVIMNIVTRPQRIIPIYFIRFQFGRKIFPRNLRDFVIGLLSSSIFRAKSMEPSEILNLSDSEREEYLTA